jgi:hypothetical protein
MRQIGPSLVDDGLGEPYSGEAAIVELFKPEAGKFRTRQYVPILPYLYGQIVAEAPVEKIILGASVTAKNDMGHMFSFSHYSFLFRSVAGIFL